MTRSYLEAEREVLEYIYEHPYVTWRRVLREFPENPAEVSMVVRSLHHEGRIKRDPIFNYDSRLCFTSAGYRYLEETREWFCKRALAEELYRKSVKRSKIKNLFGKLREKR